MSDENLRGLYAAINEMEAGANKIILYARYAREQLGVLLEVVDEESPTPATNINTLITRVEAVEPEPKFIRIKKMLRKCGITPNLQGYLFLLDAITMVNENRALLTAITRNLYQSIAEKYGSRSSLVERGMRHAIESGFRRSIGREYMETLFGDILQDKPTNTQFIAMVAERIDENE